MMSFAMMFLTILAMIFVGLGLIIYASNQGDSRSMGLGAALMLIGFILIAGAAAMAQNLKWIPS